MAEPIRIITDKKADGDGLNVTFSGGTTGAGYVAEELLKLGANCEPSEGGREEVNNGNLV
jgi:hypothetical protein